MLFTACNEDKLGISNGNIPEGGQIHRFTQLTDANYEEFLAKTPGLILMDFYADWCGPCRMMDPEMVKLKSKMGDKIEIVKIDVDKNPAASQKFKVRGIPALFLYKDGELKDAGTGYRSEEQLFAFVSKWLDKEETNKEKETDKKETEEEKE